MQIHESNSHETDSWINVERVETNCPICKANVYGAEGRGYCRECSITFPIITTTRKSIIASFLLRYFMSRNSQYYHRSGCRYLRNIEKENLIELTEPQGKPCRCVTR